MLTRGRIANHLYLQVVGDGDPHSLIRPETVHPSTATDLLEQILARDEMARSATTLERDQQDPAVRLADAAGHYVDALQVAAEDLAGREVVAALDVAAEQMVPGLIEELAWPSLRAHLLLLAAHGTDPVAQLAAAADRGELDSADDRAAVLDWRLDDTGLRNAAPGPLPWLPGIPQGLCDHPVWGNYLALRSDLVRTLADQIRASVADTATPVWVAQCGLQRGWRLDDLLRAAGMPDAGSVDAAQALLWRVSLLANPMSTDEPGESPFSAAPLEPWNNPEPPSVEIALGAWDAVTARAVSATDAVYSGPADQHWVEPDLAVAALVRGVAGPPEQTDADVNRMFTRAMAWQECSISRDRMIEINQMALSYFRSQFPSSWGQTYLTDRLGQDLTDDVRFRPGQAPAGWTGLINHLRSRGVTSEEMTAAGVATVASTGRLIDRFRDRVIFPIIHNGEILGFGGRRHPDLTDTDRVGPKYLNTADTPLFHKGAQLFGTNEVDIAAGGIPVIVEGPMDAIAVTLASGGRYIGVAPLGTSLTDEQASQLARIGTNPIVATDADIAGRVAAERDFWILTAYRLDPRYAPLPEGMDPADLLALNGPAALTTVLDLAGPLGERLIEERLTSLPPEQAQLEAARVLAARPPGCWDQGSTTISSRLNLPQPAVRQTLLAHVKEWNGDPRRAAAKPLQSVNDVKRRMTGAAQFLPEQRWAALASQLDQRLL
jgi:DNA primase catalytic core